MQGSLGQVIAIATHGSAWLRDRSSVELDGFAANSRLFLGVGDVTFDGREGLRPWLEAQAASGVERIWFSTAMPEAERPETVLDPRVEELLARRSAGGLLTVGVLGARLWRADWKPGDSTAAHRRPWKVAYEATDVEDDPQRPDVDRSARRLVAAMSAARRFTQDHGIEFPRDPFTEAVRRWTEPGLVSDSHPSLFPPGHFGARALRLASMAEGVAHLFGGMGNWDDNGFADPTTEEAYRAPSRRLFATMLEAFAASVNSEFVASA